MASPAAKALAANAIIAGSISPWTLDQPKVKEVGNSYIAAHGKKNAKASVQFGYAQDEVMYQILNKACENKDLSREGIIKAARSLSNVDTAGLVAGPVSYDKLGEASTRAVYLSKPANVIGGLTAVENGKAFESDTAKSYQFGS
jgi:hypothetical protein